MGISDKEGLRYTDKKGIGWKVTYVKKFFDGPELRNTPRSEKYRYKFKSDSGETVIIESPYPPVYHDGNMEQLIYLFNKKRQQKQEQQKIFKKSEKKS